jgi:hypothetical protein
VKLPDVNILLCAVDEGSARHQPARAWVEERLSGTETFALAWVVLLAFIRLTTSEALDLVDGCLPSPARPWCTRRAGMHPCFASCSSRWGRPAT